MVFLKIRLAYTKLNQAKYIAHLDLTRMFDRALRRAGIQVAFSEGFNPHPKIVFGPPLPVGVESYREFVDIELEDSDEADKLHLSEIVERLQKQLPQGIKILDSSLRPQKDKALMAVLNRACYTADVSFAESITTGELEKACRNWLARKEVLIERFKDKQKKNVKNIRPFVKKLENLGNRQLKQSLTRSSMFFLLVTGNEGSVRPVEILESLKVLEGLPVDISETVIVREGLFVEKEDGTLIDPLQK